MQVGSDIPVDYRINNRQISSGKRETRKKHDWQSQYLGPFLNLFIALKCFPGCVHGHICARLAVANMLLHLAEGTKEAGEAQKQLLKSPPVTLVASVRRCRCQPAGNPATLWFWSILLAGVAQYLSAKSLAWALLLHPFYFILFWKTPCSLSRWAGALLDSPRAVSPTQNILKTNRQTASDLPQTINPFSAPCSTLYSRYIVSAGIWKVLSSVMVEWNKLIAECKQLK